jgi:hypothetical protein
MQDELAVNYCHLAVVSTDPPNVAAAFRAGLAAAFTFLSEDEAGRRIGPCAAQEFLRRLEALYAQTHRREQTAHRLAHRRVVVNDVDDGLVAARRSHSPAEHLSDAFHSSRSATVESLTDWRPGALPSYEAPRECSLPS